MIFIYHSGLATLVRYLDPIAVLRASGVLSYVYTAIDSIQLLSSYSLFITKQFTSDTHFGFSYVKSRGRKMLENLFCYQHSPK